MNEQPSYRDEDSVSLIQVTNALIRSSRPILMLSALGAVLGLASGLASKRLYKSSVTFITERPETPSSGLALAASQFGVNIAPTGSTWGPPVYVELLRSRELLGPVVFDSIFVSEKGRRIALLDLLDVRVSTPALQADKAIRALANLVSVSEEKKFSAVRLSVASEWPSVSLALAQRLVNGVRDFNVQTRKTRATAERQFVDGQALLAERSLKDAEDRLLSFLQRNKVANSPELSFERSRLEREVTLRQQLYLSWLQNREEARIREIRDTPVLTILETPTLPVIGEARGTVRKAILGSIGGLIVGVVLLLLKERLAGIRQETGPDVQEFLARLDAVTRRFQGRSNT